MCFSSKRDGTCLCEYVAYNFAALLLGHMLPLFLFKLFWKGAEVSFTYVDLFLNGLVKQHMVSQDGM